MRALIACEFSGVVRSAFRALGHDAWSCDLLPAEDGSPFHIQDDALKHLGDGWDMMIAFPPCTWLCAAMRTNAARKDRPNIIPGPYKKLDFWSNKRNPGGRSLKSITFTGIDAAMASQWSTIP
jgi:hypothetical protein